MKKRTVFRLLVDVLITIVLTSLGIHFLGFEDIIDTQILSIIKTTLSLLICILFIIIVLKILLDSENEDDPIPEQQPKEYCVITFYSIVNVNRDQYMHAENSIIISEEADLLRIHSLGYEREPLPIYFSGHHGTLNIPAIDLVKELAHKNGVSTLYDCFTFNFQI